MNLFRINRYLNFLALFCLLSLPADQALFGQEGATFEADIEKLIHELVSRNWIPGAAIVIVKGDETVLLNGYGLADIENETEVTSETIFYIASSTKSFTGLAAAICDHDSRLDLDATLDQCLPDSEFHADIDPSKITLRDLLTHTHGIENNGPVTFRSAFSGQHSAEELKQLLKYHPPSKSGRTFEYGNIGYNVASLAMANSLNVHWKDLLRTEIFKPLNMKSTTGRVSEVDRSKLAMPHRVAENGFQKLHYAKSDENMHAAGGLVTTASDLANWLKININNGNLNGRQIIAKDVLNAAHSASAKQNGGFLSFKRDGYSLGWNTGNYDGEAFLHHFGGFNGFHCHISFMPEKKIGVAVLINSSSGAFFADLVSRYAYDYLREVKDMDKRYSEKQIDDMDNQFKKRRQMIAADLKRRAARSQDLLNPVEAYSGKYANEMYGEIVVSVNDGKLEASMGPLWSAVEAFDASRDLLRVEVTGRGQVVKVHFDGKQAAQRLEIDGDMFSRVEN